jgi:hypothetical protein
MMALAREWPVSWERWQEICGNKPKPAQAPEPASTSAPYAAYEYRWIDTEVLRRSLHLQQVKA